MPRHAAEHPPSHQRQTVLFSACRPTRARMQPPVRRCSRCSSTVLLSFRFSPIKEMRTKPHVPPSAGGICLS